MSYGEDDFIYAQELINTYNRIHEIGVDFDKEVVIYHHDW